MSRIAWPAGMVVQESDAAGTPCFDVAAQSWVEAVLAARDAGYTMFDWLSAVDEPEGDPAGADVVAHLVGLGPLRTVLLRARVGVASPQLASITGVFAGAAWHERETHEMFGIDFPGFDDGSGQGLRPLLLPDGFVGTPLRKSFVLAARAVKAWPGAKEPGEGGDGHGAAPSRRKLLPPAVPDPASWGPRTRAPGAAPQESGTMEGTTFGATAAAPGEPDDA